MLSCLPVNRPLAGGVFAYVLLNQRIHELDSVQSLFIHPGMGDEGLSFGAALDPIAKGEMGDDSNFSTSIPDVYLGPEFSDNEIRKVLENSGVNYEHPQNISKRIAECLRDGNVVARFDGRMEYGPRALGNRSILYQPTDPSANNWLNKKMTWFGARDFRCSGSDS